MKYQVKINSNQPSKFEDIDLSGSISDLASIFRNEATVKKEQSIKKIV